MKPVAKARSFICGEYESSMLYELVDQGHQNAEQTALIHATSRIWEKMMNIKRIGGKDVTCYCDFLQSASQRLCTG